MTELKTAQDAQATVNFWVDRGVDNFKVYNFVSRTVLGAAIAAADKRGVKVTGHLCSIGFREAAALGIDDLEHGLTVDTEFFSRKKPDQCPDYEEVVQELVKRSVTDAPIQEMIGDLVAHHVAVTSTLPVFELFVGSKASLQQRVLDAMSTDAQGDYLQTRVRLDLPRHDPKTGAVIDRPYHALFDLELRFEKAFAQAGGLLLAGLDPTGIGGVIAGFGDQREVELLVECGFTPLESIHIAIYNGARYLGEPAKQADLVVIKGDPSKNIEEIENLDMVFKDGVGYDSKKLIDSVGGGWNPLGQATAFCC